MFTEEQRKLISIDIPPVWTVEEKKKFKKGVEIYGKDTVKISEYMGSKTRD